MPRPRTDPATHVQRMQVSVPPDLLERIMRFCQKEERSMGWVVQKAVDLWLTERGF